MVVMKKVISTPYKNQFLIGNGPNPMPKLREGDGPIAQSRNKVYDWAVEVAALYEASKNNV